MLDRIEGKLRGRIENLLVRLEGVMFGNVYVEVGGGYHKDKMYKNE